MTEHSLQLHQIAIGQDEKELLIRQHSNVGQLVSSSNSSRSYFFDMSFLHCMVGKIIYGDVLGYIPPEIDWSVVLCKDPEKITCQTCQTLQQIMGESAEHILAQCMSYWIDNYLYGRHFVRESKQFDQEWLRKLSEPILLVREILV